MERERAARGKASRYLEGEDADARRAGRLVAHHRLVVLLRPVAPAALVALHTHTTYSIDALVFSERTSALDKCSHVCLRLQYTCTHMHTHTQYL